MVFNCEQSSPSKRCSVRVSLLVNNEQGSPAAQISALEAPRRVKKSADLNVILTGAEPGEAFESDTLRSYYLPPTLLPLWLSEVLKIAHDQYRISTCWWLKIHGPFIVKHDKGTMRQHGSEMCVSETIVKVSDEGLSMLKWRFVTV